MSQEAQSSHAQQFEQAIATAFTCRSVIKYNSTLSEEQKNELMADIDTTVRFLRERLLANASIEAKTVLLPLADLLAPLSLEGDNAQEDVDEEDVDEHVENEHLLRELHKIYRTYLSAKQGKDTFITRFHEAMSALAEVQSTVEKSSGIYPTPVYVEDLLQRVRGFIADLYVMFMEFTNAITLVLQGNDLNINTEQVSSLQKQDVSITNTADISNLKPLKRIYQTHLHLNEKKGTISHRVGDATAFLIFLEDNLGSNLPKRDEIVEQIYNVAKLLSDLAYLLTDYEKATSVLLERTSS